MNYGRIRTVLSGFGFTKDTRRGGMSRRNGRVIINVQMGVTPRVSRWIVVADLCTTRDRPTNYTDVESLHRAIQEQESLPVPSEEEMEQDRTRFLQLIQR